MLLNVEPSSNNVNALIHLHTNASCWYSGGGLHFSLPLMNRLNKTEPAMHYILGRARLTVTAQFWNSSFLCESSDTEHTVL